MKATPDQLQARWLTEDGKRRLETIVKMARNNQEWSSILVGFPWVEEVENGRDLRMADFWKANLGGANFSSSNLLGCKFLESDLIGANVSKSILLGANLMQARLIRVNFSEADLSGVFFLGSDLKGSYLVHTNLVGANLVGTELFKANFIRAKLHKADFSGAVLTEATFDHCDMTEVDLTRCQLVKTNLNGCNLSGAKVFGVSAWGLAINGTKQENLVITDKGEPQITVDDIQVAQFIYLLLNNKNIRNIIDTITSKVVLLLGRFTDERKAVLDAIRQELRNRNYTAVLFDFDKPASRDITETVNTLAHMARFVIADITDAKSIPQELAGIVPNLPSVAIQPLILKGQREYGMFEHFRKYPWVLPIHEYDDQDALIANIGQPIIAPAEAKVKELASK